MIQRISNMVDTETSDREQSNHNIKKHSTVSISHERVKTNPATTMTANESSEEHDDDNVPAMTSPSRTKSRMSERSKVKRRKSSTGTTSHKTSRPAYSRKYSTPPSRPLSPSGYPQLLESDGVIPEIDLNQTISQSRHWPPQPQQQYQNHIQRMQQHQPQQFFELSVDTAPQEPDLWDDPETDYFSTFEGTSTKHSRSKSRREISQNMNAVLQQSMAPKGLQQISEDGEFLLPPTPGAFAA